MGGRKEGREGWRERGREGGREGGREPLRGSREGGRERVRLCESLTDGASLPPPPPVRLAAVQQKLEMESNGSWMCRILLRLELPSDERTSILQTKTRDGRASLLGITHELMNESRAQIPVV